MIIFWIASHFKFEVDEPASLYYAAGAELLLDVLAVMLIVYFVICELTT